VVEAEERSERQLNPTNVDLEFEVENAILRYRDQVNRGVTDGSYGEYRRENIKLRTGAETPRQAGI
jgi:hypothetical protein